MNKKTDFHCSRVKSLCFHRFRRWLLCGLYSGAVTIFDYRLEVIVDVFNEHDGAVRAVDFHKTQPLFVSGGDDFLVKVWNYNLRRCLFNLYGHTDYIRSTFFHSQNPWIVSASDDYTIRIWNWQNRTCMSILQGHRHFVMCAKFYVHPFLISCSLDKSIRVWNISTVQEQIKEDFGLSELLGVTNVTVEFESQKHRKGVNWIDCQVNEGFSVSNEYTNKIASGADDGEVILYTFYADHLEPVREPNFSSRHNNNVCCVMFHRGFLFSCSEDRSILGWVLSSSSWTKNIFRATNSSGRYWIMASSENRNLIAAGHDSGFEIYKVHRERPIFALMGNVVYRKTVLISTKSIVLRWTDLTTNEVGERVLVTFSKSDKIYREEREQLYVVNNDEFIVANQESGSAVSYLASADKVKETSFLASSVVPGAPGKLIVLSKERLYTYPDKIQLETPFTPTRIFHSVPGTILCLVEKKIVLYHLAQRTVIAELVAPDVKYVEWDKKMQRVALLAKNSLTIATRSLKLLTIVAESSAHIKTAVFDDTFDVVYFSTSYHLKYCNLFNYEVNTIYSTRNSIYLVKASVDKIWYFSKFSNEVLVKELENSELTFKQKLHQKAYREVIQILSRGKLKGQALVGYLHQKNYSEVALQIEKDPLARFYLSLACGDLSVAKETAELLDRPHVWKKMAEAALAFGDIQLAKMASARGGNYQYAGLLALVSGSTASAAPLADSTDDVNFQMQQALYRNDPRQRIRLFVDAGQLTLAYLTARSANLPDLAEVISASMDPKVVERLSKVPCAALRTPTSEDGTEAAISPITDNWPLLRIEPSIFSRMLKDPTLASGVEVAAEIDLGDAMGEWGEESEERGGLLGDIKLGRHGGDTGHSMLFPNADEESIDEDAWGEEEDLGIDVKATLSQAKVSGQKRAYVTPAVHPPIEEQWNRSSHPTHLLLAGSFDAAFAALKKEICLSNPKPLIPVVKYLWKSVNMVRPSWRVPSTTFVLTTASSSAHGNNRMEPSFPNIQALVQEKLNQGFQLFVNGKFNVALNVFKSILHYSVLVCPEWPSDALMAIKECRQQAAEYARALSLELQLKQEDPSSPRALALALYFTHFNLFRPHMILALSQAMSKSFKLKHFRTAAVVGRRLLDLEPPKAKADQAAAIIFDGETKEDRTDIEYDGLNPFDLCCVSFTPVYKGTGGLIWCPYCKAPALTKYAMNLCPVCELSPLGAVKSTSLESI